MATPPLALEYVLPATGRVVRRLVRPTIRPKEPAASPEVHLGAPRSPFWEHQYRVLAETKAQVAELKTLQGGLTVIGGKIDTIGGRSHFTVTTGLDQAGTELLTRGIDAVEKLVTNTTPPPPDTCATRDDMSDLAFAIVARLNTLASYLMDRHDVSLDSVIDKLTDPGNIELIKETRELILQAQAPVTAELLRRAVDPSLFQQWQKQGGQPDDSKFFDEVRQRAALLLAAKCQVATMVTGAADDWPPPAPTPGVAQPTAKTRRRAS